MSTIPRRVQVFVAFVGLLALSAGVALCALQGGNSPSVRQPVIAFAALGLLAYCLAHDLAKAAAGSVAFLPWLAALFSAPSGETTATLAVAVALGELYRRKAAIKAAFNVAQYALSFATAGALYLVLGGAPLLGGGQLEPLPYLVACGVFFATNGLSVAAVLGIAEQRRVLEVWRATFRSNVANDLIAMPVVYGFVLIYAKTGVLGIVVLAALLLGARQLYKTNAQLQITNRELLEVLVHAIELRDPYTSGHSQRVAAYARVIGRAIGMSTKQIERLSVAALLHDVGKIDQMFVPILSKPGRLTPEERAIMELHPIKSAELVAKVSELADVVLPIRHHHEAWDGSGYPDGLKGPETPLLARVIVFADTIDAMTTDRPYRKAMGPSEVRAELLRCRGTQFDPSICDALLDSPYFDVLFEAGVVKDRGTPSARSSSPVSGIRASAASLRAAT